MKFSIRRDVSLTNFSQDLYGLGSTPIELALPYKLDTFIATMAHLPSLESYILNPANGIIVNTVHAPQGRLADDSFITWALPTVQFAESIGAEVVVFHPESVPKLSKPNAQGIALENVKTLQNRTSVTVAIETFGNTKRIITTEEIIEFKLPMILDTSHLFQRRIFQIIEAYHAGIVGVHLSEMRADTDGETRPHLPVESYGFTVLEKLKKKGWNGSVTLEYLYEYHDKLANDRQALQKMFQ